MTREEAIDRLMWLKDVPHINDDKWIEAIDMAIEALKRPQAEWVKAVDDGIWSFTDAYAECDQCHKVTFNGWNMNYCPNCGADMRGEGK